MRLHTYALQTTLCAKVSPSTLKAKAVTERPLRGEANKALPS